MSTSNDDICYVCGANQTVGEYCDTKLHNKYQDMSDEERKDHAKKMEKKAKKS